jgi:hypothetical protein
VNEPLLTDAEHAAMDLTIELVRVVYAIIGTGDGAAANDRREAFGHVHAIQQMIMSQAAARAYPDRYRLLGNTP